MLRRIGLIATGILGIGFGGLVFRWWLVRQQRDAAPNPQSLIQALPNLPQATQANDSTLTINWSHTSSPVYVYVANDIDSLSQVDPSTIISNGQSTTLAGFDPKQRYFVQLAFADGTSQIISDRIVRLEKAPNVRDVGGYITQDGRQVAWGKVYRASALSRLSTNDQDELQRMGIKLICDMRTHEEVADDPDQLPNTIEYINLAAENNDSRLVAIARLLFDADYLPNVLKDLYTRIMLDENAHVFGAIFERMGNPNNLPMIIHCAAGKDRTGIATALLLSLLGVPDEVVIADYTQSNHHYDYFMSAARKIMAQLTLFGITEDDFAYLLIADGQVMRHTLDYLYDNYDSAENYLHTKAGVSAEAINSIREQMLR